ncbi:MAG: DNA-binding protein [Bacteroidetes bacterium]|uniref:DNA-binding protein n=1 Tax=Candidatus Cryptobacteroides merdavium TaxID=2840769 RepID=A0A9D9HD09_9BACT|nr:DNA-binding protein [Candidatus Cryptobacteroides merdavium]
MKLKYALAAAASGIFLLAACTQEYEISYLDEIRLSETFVSIPVDGSSVTVNLTANADWNIVAEVRAENEEGDDIKDENGNFVYEEVDLPEWLTITPLSGAAGEHTLTFSADPTDAGRETNLVIYAGGKKQNITVRQGEIVATAATCQEVLDGPDGKSFIVTGTCTRIANTQYGNWYLADETGEIYIYGTVDATGSYNWTSFNIEVGDVVTVRGPKTTYNGIVELVDVRVVSVEKSLLQSVATEFTVTKDGGEVEAQFVVKGDGLQFDLPAELSSWISINNIRTFEDEDGENTITAVTISVGPNDGDARVASIPFSSSNSEGSSSATVTITQEGNISDRTVAELLAMEPSDIDYYRLTGKVSDITNTVYGNFNLVDGTGSIYVYGLTATQQESNDKTFASLGIEEGDILTLIGTRDEYNGTPQVGGPAYYVSHVGHTEATVAEVLAAAEDDTWYKVTGTVSNLVNTEYGNFDLVDGASSIYVYGLTNAPVDSNDKSFASLGIKEGDTVTLIGKRASYGGNPQIAGAYYFSHTAAGE